MAPVKRRRSLPTLVDRGLGLLEIILPRGASESPSLDIPGQRDDSGFWFPSGFTKPGDIFTPEQRRLQAKQRVVQRRRRDPRRPGRPARATDGLIPDATPSVPHAPPGEAAPPASGLRPGGSDLAAPPPPALQHIAATQATQRKRDGARPASDPPAPDPESTPGVSPGSLPFSSRRQM